MRPLSTLAQAESLMTTLAADEITTVWCSPSVRCRQTLEPLAGARGLHLRTSARLSKTAHPARMLAWLQTAGPDAPWVVCTHGEVLTALYNTARRGRGRRGRHPQPDREGRPLAAEPAPPPPRRTHPAHLHPTLPGSHR